MVHPGQKKIISKDEIDLGELFRVLAHGWKTIALITLAFLVLAGVYVFIKTPVYQSSTRVVPVSDSALAALNRFESYQFTPENAYYRFSERLASYQNFANFVGANDPSLGEVEDLSQLFAEQFSFNNQDNNQERLALSVSFKYPETVYGAKILNDYIDWTANDVRIDLMNSIIQVNGLRIDELEKQRQLLKQKLVSEREARIFELGQAIQTAKALGIEKPTLPQEIDKSAQPTNRQALFAGIQSNDWQLPLYFMGTDVLQAESSTIQDEIDKGLSSEAIRELTQQIEERKDVSGRFTALLRETSPKGLESLQVVDVVDAAYKPTKPVAPKRLIILFIALVVGGFLGVCIVLIKRTEL